MKMAVAVFYPDSKVKTQIEAIFKIYLSFGNAGWSTTGVYVTKGETFAGVFVI